MFFVACGLGFRVYGLRVAGPKLRRVQEAEGSSYSDADYRYRVARLRFRVHSGVQVGA